MNTNYGLEKEWEAAGTRKGECILERRGYGRYIHKIRSEDMLDVQAIEIFEGQWDRNCLEGYGRHIDCKGNMYMGEFSNGMKEHQGLYLFADGDTYQGQWHKNKFHGMGTYMYKKT